MQDSNIKELTVAPTSEWINELAKEIADNYSLPDVERVFIAGIICIHLRKEKLI